MSVSEELTAEIENATKQFMEEQQGNEASLESQEEEDVEKNQDDEQLEEVSGESQAEEKNEEKTQAEEDKTQVAEEKHDDGYEVDIPSQLLGRAIDLGFTPEDIATFPTARSLATACIIAEKSRGKQEEVKEKEPDKEDIFSGLNEEDYDPEVLKVLKHLGSKVKEQQQEIESLKSSYSQFSVVRQKESAQQLEAWFDTQIKNLGEEFEPILGKGLYNSLDRQSPQFAKREAIADQMRILLAGHGAVGNELPPLENVFSQAVGLVLKDEIKTIEDKKLSKDLESRSRQHINRPGGKGLKSKSQDPEDAIAKILDEKYFKRE